MANILVKLEDMKKKGLIKDFTVTDGHHHLYFREVVENYKVKVARKKITEGQGKKFLREYVTFWVKEFYGKHLDIKTEFQFAKERGRKFRFDFLIMDWKVAIEYEGIFSEKSRHTTFKGYSQDLVKYNLAAVMGYIVLRYSASNVNNIDKDLKEIYDSKNSTIAK